MDIELVLMKGGNIVSQEDFSGSVSDARAYADSLEREGKAESVEIVINGAPIPRHSQSAS